MTIFDITTILVITGKVAVCGKCPNVLGKQQINLVSPYNTCSDACRKAVLSLVLLLLSCGGWWCLGPEQCSAVTMLDHVTYGL